MKIDFDYKILKLTAENEAERDWIKDNLGEKGKSVKTNVVMFVENKKLKKAVINIRQVDSESRT
jgi:hypothetical protein